MPDATIIEDDAFQGSTLTAIYAPKVISDNIINASKNYLNMDVKYLGYVYEDKTIPYSVSQQFPFYQYDNKCQASSSLYNIAKKIVDMEYNDSRATKGLSGFMETLSRFLVKNSN